MKSHSASLLSLTLLAGTALVATAAPVKPVIPDAARPLPLSAVRLTGGPLKHAEDLDAKYLLDLEPDRMLYYFRVRAGLEPKAQRGYGGWDGGGRQLTGHICGHYLSAVSYMYAATGDVRYKERADYIVKELAEVQAKQGDGYLGALMGNSGTGRGGGGGGAGAGNNAGTNQPANRGPIDGKTLFNQLSEGIIRSGGFDLNGMWSPWYVEHKVFAGLRDAHRLCGSAQALEVETKFAGWVDHLLSGLTEAQIQRMLATEFGGMNDVMFDLYADTGDARWLKAADYFNHRSFVDPLARYQDILSGKHGNTAVPKMLGELTGFIYTGDLRDGLAASFFWDRVVNHHSFATGGHGRNEYFGVPDKLSDMVDGRTAESCNVYNMIKMTRRLFALWPDARYADFHERALFNHVLGSMDPEDGATCYMVCVGQSPRQREYERNMLDGGFTCCVGSGMESHALHGDGLYYESGDKLWVNIYAPSTADWKQAGVKLNMDTGFPEGDTATLKLTAQSPKEFTLALRKPFWAGEGFSVKVNGEAVNDAPADTGGGRQGGRGGGRGGAGQAAAQRSSTYVEIKRTWKTGDTVTMALPKMLREEPLPDNPRRVALMWGPLVLAGDLGEIRGGRGGGRGGARGADQSASVPVFLAANKPVADWLKPVADKPGSFHSEGVGRDKDVDFVPFYRLHRRAYGVYWELFTPEEWEQKAVGYNNSQDKQRRLEAATVGYAQPGEMQPERDFNFQAEESTPVRVMEKPARRGTKWFSFDLPVDATHPMTLAVTYNSDEQATRSFEILVDGKRVGEQTIERRSPEQVAKFFDVEYPIPADSVRGKQKVTVRFQATNGNEIGAVFGLRMLRADAER